MVPPTLGCLQWLAAFAGVLRSPSRRGGGTAHMAGCLCRNRKWEQRGYVAPPTHPRAQGVGGEMGSRGGVGVGITCPLPGTWSPGQGHRLMEEPSGPGSCSRDWRSGRRSPVRLWTSPSGTLQPLVVVGGWWAWSWAAANRTQAGSLIPRAQEGGAVPPSCGLGSRASSSLTWDLSERQITAPPLPLETAGLGAAGCPEKPPPPPPQLSDSARWGLSQQFRHWSTTILAGCERHPATTPKPGFLLGHPPLLPLLLQAQSGWSRQVPAPPQLLGPLACHIPPQGHTGPFHICSPMAVHRGSSRGNLWVHPRAPALAGAVGVGPGRRQKGDHV